MTVHVLGIGGAPGCGKTTLFRELFPFLTGEPRRTAFKFKAHVGYHGGNKVVVLGDYTVPMGGTDKLSMSVAPKVVEFVEALSKLTSTVLVAFEGDRLFAAKTLHEIDEVADSLTTYVLDARQIALRIRRDARGDSQNPTWLKGRMTKIEALKRSHEVLPYTTVQDVRFAKSQILEWLNEERS